jgi:Glycosyl hydrolase catalytic core
MGPRSRAAALLIAALLAAVLAATASTSASTQTSSSLRVGIFDDGEVLYGVPGQVFPLLKASRAQIIRTNLWWYASGIHVATRRPHDAADPADPAYDWSAYDAVVTRAAANGQQVVFSVLGTPPWANQSRGWNVAPTNAKELKFFAMAAAERYSGSYANDEGDKLPRVAKWIAWNEPNNPVFLKPQFARDSTSATGWRIQSARDYARVCNAVVQGVKVVQRTAKVACGVTSPRGNNNPTSGRPSVSPLAFARALRKAGAIGFDAYAHHPYYGAPSETPSTPPPPGANGRPSTAVTLGNLNVLISEVTRLWGNKRIWITEYGYQTNPTDTIVGVSWAKQAQYLKQAVAIARKDPRIDMFIWFLLIDETRNDGWQSGLIGSDLVKKPSFNAFKQAVG